MTSPTQLTLAALRGDGWTVVEVVETFPKHAKVRRDLFGFIDILALRPGQTLAVQTTTASNMAARVTKIREHPNLAAVKAAGWYVQVDGWRMKDGRWVRRVQVM